MPTISTFFGIIIRMWHDDHPPIHIHAEYQGFEALVDVKTGLVSLETAVGRTKVGLNWRVQLGETRQRPLGRNEEQRRCSRQGRLNWGCSAVTHRVCQLEAKNMSKIKCL